MQKARAMPDKPSLFMRCVMLHERAWGLRKYRNRPTLEQFMNAKIVAFWYPTDDEMPFTATIHNDIKEIDDYVTTLVLHNPSKMLPRLRLERVFVEKKQVKIRGIHVQYAFTREDD